MADKAKKVAIQLSLDVDKQGAVAQVKGVTEQMKKILTSFEKSGGSFEIFNDLVKYLKAVEEQCLKLKNINPVKFNDLFGKEGGADLNSAISSQITGILDTAKQVPDVIAKVQGKIDNLGNQTSIKVGEVREIGNDIKGLYTLMGQTPKLDLDFKGQRGSAAQLDVLRNALNDFKVDWLDFVNTVKSSGEGSETTAINQKIEELKAEKSKYDEVIRVINGENIKIKTTKKDDVAQVKELVAQFLQARDAVQQYESAKNTSGDAYKKSLAEEYRLAVLLKNTMDYIGDHGSDAGISYVMDQSTISYDQAEKVIEKFGKLSTEYKNQITNIYSSLANGIDEKILNLQKPSVNAQQTITSYEQLSAVIKEYIKLQQEMDNVTSDAEYEVLDEKIEKVSNSLIKASGAAENILNMLRDDEISEGDAISIIAKDMGIEIPNAAQKAEDTVTSAFAKITKEADKASESTQKVMYHLGNLLNGKGAPQDTFGDMTENLTSSANGTRYEQYGFGVFGGGLFGVTNPSTISHEPGKSTFIQSIDLSKYNMYIADTEERASALIDFLSKLQKFSIKSAEPNYTGFDQYLQGVDIDSLYSQFKVVFDQSELTKKQFQEFISEMVNLLKQAGVAFDAQTGELGFANISDELANSENISTRFMKMLGFQGVNVGTTSFDGFGQGSVLFDFDKADIVGYFEDVKSAVQDYEKMLQQTNGDVWVGTNEQLKQYASNIDIIIDKLQQYKSSGVLLDTSEIDETLNKLTQIRENIENILLGKDVNEDKAFETITTGSDNSSVTNQDQIAQLEKEKALMQELEELKAKLNAIPTNPVDASELEIAKKQVQDLEDEIQRMQGSLDEWRASYSDLLNTTVPTDEIDNMTSNDVVDSYRDKVDNLQSIINQLNEELTTTKASLEEMQTISQGTTDSAEVKVLREQVAQLESQLAQAQSGQEGAIETSSEIQHLEALREKLEIVKQAIISKNKAFNDEGIIVGQVVGKEIVALQHLLDRVNEISEALNQLFNNLNSGTDIANGLSNININVNGNINEAESNSYALESTLGETNTILGEIKSSVDAIGRIAPKNPRPTLEANARITDSKEYEHIKDIVLNSIGDKGTDPQITGVKALADGLVQVNGYIKTVKGNYEDFVVKINSAGEAIGLAFSENQKLTQQMQKEAAAQEAFSNNFNLVTDEFIKYKDSIDQSDQIMAKFSDQIQQMENRLATVSNGSELDAWKTDWDALTASIEKAKQEQEKLILETQKRKDIGTLNSIDKSRNEIYKNLKVDTNKIEEGSELDTIRKKYLEIGSTIDEYKKKREALTEEEINGLKQAEAELQEMARAYVRVQQAQQEQEDAVKNAYGASQVKNIGKKYTQLSGVASGAEFADSATVQAALSNLETSYQRLIDKQQEFAGIDPTAEQKREFARLTDQYNQAHSALDNIIKSSRKLAEKGVGDPYEIVSGTNMADEGVRMQELQNAVNLFSNGSAKIGQFNADFTELSYTVKNADGTFTEFTAVLDSTGTKIVNVAGKAKESTSLFKSAFDSIKKKSKEILTYMTSMGVMSRVIGQIKQGIQYVKDIDAALTELKKVTDETDATYEKFLKTASAAGAEIGTTISDFTNATADFARLGYSITEATDLAKAASIYKNVGDGITSVSQASESIISTMKAFGIEANDAMGIVNRFNEVGNNFAISSTGIGEALQRSASALYESGNTIDESIALITAANSVVQNPETVGTAMKTLSLRLRGAKADLEDAGEEVDGMCDSVSELQAKLLALTGGKVDIMLGKDTFKNTTEILREMSQAWDDMTDVNRADCCPYVQKCA